MCGCWNPHRILRNLCFFLSRMCWFQNSTSLHSALQNRRLFGALHRIKFTLQNDSHHFSETEQTGYSTSKYLTVYSTHQSEYLPSHTLGTISDSSRFKSTCSSVLPTLENNFFWFQCSSNCEGDSSSAMVNDSSVPCINIYCALSTTSELLLRAIE